MNLSTYLIEAVVTLCSVSALYSKYALTVAKKKEAHVKEAASDLEARKELQKHNEQLQDRVDNLEARLEKDKSSDKDREVLVPGSTVLCHLGGLQYTRGTLKKLSRQKDDMRWVVQVGEDEISFSTDDIKLAPAQPDPGFRESAR